MYKLISVENKGKDWTVVSLVNAAGELIDNVSVNRVSKKGDVFPNFDGLAEGQKIDARLWESPSNKMYLFAPKGGAKAIVKQTRTENPNPMKDEDNSETVRETQQQILNKLTGLQLQLGRLEDALIPPAKVKKQYEHLESAISEEDEEMGTPF